MRSFKDYSFEKRRVIYGTFIGINLWAVVDTLAKGSAHLTDLGTIYVAGTTLNLFLAGLAIYIANERFHQIVVILLSATFTANMIILFAVID